MGHHSTLIGGGKGEGCLFCSDAHTIVASVVNVLTRIVAVDQTASHQLTILSLHSSTQKLCRKTVWFYKHFQTFFEAFNMDCTLIIYRSGARGIR